MKHAVLAVILTVGLLPACTTVEITNAGQPAPIAHKYSKDSTLLKRTAARMTSLFETKGWCDVRDEQTHQTAAQILLEGLKSGDDLAVTTRDYASGYIAPSELLTDIKVASSHVEQTTVLARKVLTENLEDQTVSAELSALEKALIAARQAEDTFRSALEMHDMTSTSAFNSYSENVDDLRAVTDAFGYRMRGSVLTPNG